MPVRTWKSRICLGSLLCAMVAPAILPWMSPDILSSGNSAQATPATQEQAALNTKSLDAILGRTGTLKDGIYKIAFPRTDLRVVADGVRIKPGLALGSWVAFKAHGKRAVTMGDFVLLEREVNPVIEKLEENGIEVSAVHNHLLAETPRVLYVHFVGHGDAEKLAHGLHAALALTKTPIRPAVSSAKTARQNPLWNPEGSRVFDMVEKILELHGSEKNGVFQIGVPRSEKITMEHAGEIPPFMGTATSLNFQASPKGIAATGDFVLSASEVNLVIKDLQAAGIKVTALHSHMLDESPRLFFMHFWGNGDPAKIAHGLRTALEKTDSILR